MPGKESKIMTMPLPQILEELEDYIRRVEEATKKAEQATIEAHKAAEEAKLAGEKAAGEAAKVAKEKIGETEDRLRLEVVSVRELAEEALTTAKSAVEFAGKINRAQVSSLNAAVKAYNEAIAP